MIFFENLKGLEEWLKLVSMLDLSIRKKLGVAIYLRPHPI